MRAIYIHIMFDHLSQFKIGGMAIFWGGSYATCLYLDEKLQDPIEQPEKRLASSFLDHYEFCKIK